MTVEELVGKLNLKVISGYDGIHNEVKGVYVSDLLSDAMANARENDIWVTLHTHENIMAVASLKDLAAIIIVKNRMPDEVCIKKSNEENIPILITPETTYNLVGKLYALLTDKKF